MALDLQVVSAQELVELRHVRMLPGVEPRTLDVLGADFRSVDEVLIGGFRSPDVVVVSATRLLAQVPTALGRQPIPSVKVVSRRLAMGRESTLRFRLGDAPSGVRGLLRLTQRFLRMLLTTPGTDIFAPAVGGAALRNIGLTFGRDEGGSIVSDFILAVANTERQLVALQGREPSLPASERLLSARVAAAGFRRSEGALLVSVELTSQAGESTTAEVTV